MSRIFHFGAVILAAGASTRMGRPKQLLPIGGRSLIRHIAEVTLASPARPVMVVLGAHMASIRPEVAGLPVLIVENHEWEKGLATSIRAGMRVIDSISPSVDAAVLVLCDQPNLSPGAITRLADLHRGTGKSIVAAHYDGHSGPPALFARSLFRELMELKGPGGARPLFARHPDLLATVDLPELVVDLDTPEDFAAWRQNP